MLGINLPPLDRRVPVTVLTGFLGAGKTTLLNRVLSEKHGKRIAVIENEFGEIGIDHDLVVGVEEEIFEMNNGCLCCTVRGDLIRTLRDLARSGKRFDHVLIETTGLANPGPVAQTFFVDDEIAEKYRLDAIVTLVDARHVELHLDDADECRSQIAFADRLLLNKVDLAETADFERLEARLRAMNSMARFYRTQHGELPLDQILGVRAFELDSKLETFPDLLELELPFEWAGLYHLEAGPARLELHHHPEAHHHDHDGHDHHDHDHDHHHDEHHHHHGGDAVRVALLSAPEGIEASKARAVGVFEGQTQALGASEAAQAGALLAIEPESAREVVVPEAGTYALWLADGAWKAHLEQGGRELEAREERVFAHSHSHDDEVSSVGMEIEGECDAGALNEWLSDLLETKGADIFRTKGVIAIKGAPVRFVFQGVHMLFDGQPDRPWKKGEARVNRLIFIGRNLDRAALENGFRACLV